MSNFDRDYTAYLKLGCHPFEAYVYAVQQQAFFEELLETMRHDASES